MALQTSGQISLNDIHLELDATSGTEVTMGDVDVRGLIDVNLGDQVAMNAFYGVSNSIDITGTSFTNQYTSTGKIAFNIGSQVEFTSTAQDYLDFWDESFTYVSGFNSTYNVNTSGPHRISVQTYHSSETASQTYIGFSYRDNSGNYNSLQFTTHVTAVTGISFELYHSGTLIATYDEAGQDSFASYYHENGVSGTVFAPLPPINTNTSSTASNYTLRLIKP
jgi:hypothetical protein